eukprot:sb/3475547/
MNKPTEIIPGLFLGNRTSREFTGVVSLLTEDPPTLPENTRHLFICVNDVPDARILQRIDEICDFINSILESDGTGRWQEPTETSKQPIRTRYLRHLTGYQPIGELVYAEFIIFRLVSFLRSVGAL